MLCDHTSPSFSLEHFSIIVYFVFLVEIKFICNYYFLFRQPPRTHMPGVGTLPHYSLGDLGLIPRPAQNITTSVDKMKVISKNTKLGALRGVLQKSVACQTVSAPKVRSHCVWIAVLPVMLIFEY